MNLKDEVEKLRKHIAGLEDGACRYNCRTKATMWKAGGRYVWDHWNKLSPPADIHLDEMYEQWRKEND